MAKQLLELLTRDIQLRRVASTHGGEYAGPCPFCGGTDRFRVWPDAISDDGKVSPHYWCRRCERGGDAIHYLMDKDGLHYRQACAYLGIPPGARSSADYQAGPRPIPLVQEPPSIDWQRRAVQFGVYARDHLWMAENAEMLEYLHGRGLKDETIQRAALGYHEMERYDQPARWGLESEKDIWLPAGLVIPGRTETDSNVWRVNIRTADPRRRYAWVQGSHSMLYHADLLTRAKPAMLLEGELDVLLVEQEAGDLVTPVATCGTKGARHNYWMLFLATPYQVFVSFDADQAGDEDAQWWLDHVPHARRWRPILKDPTDMQRAGFSVREWVEDSLRGPFLPPARLTPVQPVKRQFKPIAGNPGAIRKLAIDPDTQPKLSVVTTAKMPAIPRDAIPSVMRPGEASLFLAKYGARHNYTAEWNGQRLGAPGDAEQWKRDTYALHVADMQRCATDLHDWEQGKVKAPAQPLSG